MTDVVRLQKFFKPSKYNLRLNPNKSNMTFSGSVKIVGQISRGQSVLQLHTKDLHIKRVKINSKPAKFKLIKEADNLQISLPPNLKRNNLTVDISFSGNITKPMHGMYPSQSHNGDIAIVTQFESHHAREVFPCIDEPAAKAVFSLTLKVPKNEIALSNTLPAASKQLKYHSVIRYKDTPIMSTYLLAFVIGKFHKKETIGPNGVIIRAWVAGSQVKQTEFCLDVAKRSLDFFNEYFKIPYPLAKLDLVALADFSAAAMENFGLITFRESCMLVDEQNTSLDSKQFVATVVAHEIAHQWFGDLVTMQWWNDLWLNEGFASWIEYLAVDHMFPEWHMWTQFLVSEQLPALRLDALANTHPIEVRVPNPDVIRTIFDNISYCKGACVIHMLHEYLGDEMFRAGLTDYLKKYAYQNSNTEDLWQSLERTSHKPVKQYMSAWTTQAGFPLVEVVRRTNKLLIRQKRFSSDTSNSESPVWPIPLLASTISDTMFDTSKMQVATPKNLNIFKLNEGQAGFYITRYWPQHYQRLSNLIASGRLAENDRLSLLSDTLALTKNGRLPLIRLVQLLSSYKSETSAPVWDSIAITISDVRRVMGPMVRQAIKPLVNVLTIEQIERLGWDERSNESYFDKLLRPLVLALADSADNIKVADEARRQFDKANVAEDITKDLRSMILISVSRRGKQSEFSKMLGMYQSTSSSEDKMILGSALTNFRRPAQYRQALKMIKSDAVRLQDAIYWLAGSLANPASRDIAWEWIKQNWRWIKINLSDDVSYTRLPVYVSMYFSNKTFIKDYRDFFKKVAEPGLVRSTRQGIETIKLQANWRQRDADALLAWLEKL